MNQKEINESEWSNKNNWKWASFYSSDVDTRVWVPKRPRWTGWTLNFAKSQSYVWLFLLLVVPTVFVIFMVLNEWR